MKISRLSVLPMALVILSFLFSCSRPSEKALQAEIDALLERTFPSDGPGATILVAKDGNILYDRSRGLADMQTGNRLTDSTFYNICSVSKQFSAVALMLLSERRLLSLDDTVDKYFPEFKAPFYGKITLRHILSHTSGIPDARPRNEAEWQEYLKRNASKYNRVEDFKRFCEEDESCRYLETLENLNFEPGTHYEYMNPTFQLVLGIVEKVTGEDFDTWMKENIFIPAGMPGAFYFSPGVVYNKNISHGYSLGDDGKWHEDDYGEANFFGTKADGGLYTTPLEFLSWDMALFSDKVITETTRKEMHTSRIATDIPETNYGYGWFIENRTDRPQKIYHTGDNGGYYIFEGHFPENKVFYLIFANQPEWDRDAVVEEMDQILLRCGIV